MARKDITLRSEKAERYSEAKTEVDQFLGYDATDTEAVMLIIATSDFGDAPDYGEPRVNFE